MITAEKQKDYSYKIEEHCNNCNRFAFHRTPQGAIYPRCLYFDALLLVDTQAPPYYQNVYRHPNCLEEIAGG